MHAEPSFDPRPGDYDAMLSRAGRRRRTRRLRATALASVTAVAVVAQVAPASRGGHVSLNVADAPTAPAAPTGEPGSPTPTPSPTKPTPTPSPTSSDLLTVPSVPPLPLPTSSPTPKPTPTPTPTETHPGPRPTPSPADPPDEPATYAYLDGAAPSDCRTAQGAQSAPDTKNWCAVYAGPTTVEANEPGSLPFRLCRSSALGVGDGTLTGYGNGTWLKARAVASDGTVPWSWYGGTPPAQRTITVAPGDCAEWTLPWDAPLDPGSYRLNPVFIVEEYMPHPQPEFAVEVVR